jgi:uncharacterized protein
MIKDNIGKKTLPFRVHILAKPTGAACNLDCAYCFFLEKEKLYPGSRFRMNDTVLEAYISQLTTVHKPQSRSALPGRAENRP